jgi:hypothetical protein
MDGGDLALRNTTYALFVREGRAPTAEDVARETRRPEEEVRAAWERLHDEHAIVLDAETRSIRMANPFSAVTTPHRVEAAGRSWYANCAWDAFGICAALHADGRIQTACADCGERIDIHVRDREPDDTSLLFHCLVPASYWWDDIVYT